MNPRFFDLFREDSWRNVHAGELEVRPPGVPTIWTSYGAEYEPAAIRRSRASRKLRSVELIRPRGRVEPKSKAPAALNRP
jgi:hypothetical protein